MPGKVLQVPGKESSAGKLIAASLQEQWLVTPGRWPCSSLLQLPQNSELQDWHSL